MVCRNRPETGAERLHGSIPVRIQGCIIRIHADRVSEQAGTTKAKGEISMRLVS